MVTLLISLAILLAGIGVYSLSQATTGVGLLAVACFLGILARIAQANNQHEKIEDLLRELKEDQDTESSSIP